MRILHTMVRVGDLERSIRFYTDVMKMKLLRKREFPEGKFTLAFVGYGDEADSAVLELTYNWGVEKYEIGSGYGHIAVAVEDENARTDNGRAGVALLDRVFPSDFWTSGRPAVEQLFVDRRAVAIRAEDLRPIACVQGSGAEERNDCGLSRGTGAESIGE